MMKKKRLMKALYATFVFFAAINTFSQEIGNLQMTQVKKLQLETNKDVVSRLLDEAFNKGNMEICDELIAENFAHHAPNMPDALGSEGYKQMIGFMRSVYPDVQITIHDLIAEGNTVVTRQTYTGTHQGAFMDIPPTGRTLTFTGICCYAIENEKVKEGWTIYDALGENQQMTSPESLNPEDFDWPSPITASGDPGDLESNKAFIQQYLDDLHSGAKTLEKLDQYISDSDTAFKQHILFIESGFPGYEIQVEEIIAEEDKVVVRGLTHGTYTGEQTLPFPSTGKSFTIPIHVIYRIADGMIVEHWMNADDLGVGMQVAPSASGLDNWDQYQ